MPGYHPSERKNGYNNTKIYTIMITDDIISRIIAYACGNGTEEDKQFLEEWVLKSPENEKIFRSYLTHTNKVILSQRAASLGKLKLHANNRKRLPGRNPLRRLAGYAASLAVLIGLGALIITRLNGGEEVITRVTNDVVLTLPDGSEITLDASTENSLIVRQEDAAITRKEGRLIAEKYGETVRVEQKWATVEVPKGTLFDMQLEDGTKVWLNAHSRMRFPIVFSGGERRVYLEGEAYFDVASDAEIPFFVETPTQTLRVLGTEFNIRTYDDLRAVYTTLVNGRVELSSKATDSKIVLEPGYQAQLSDASGDYVVAMADLQTIGLWRERVIVFGGNTLDRIFADLSRWYDITYHFETPRLAKLQLFGEVPIYENIDRILKQIETAGQVSIERSKNSITIKANK